MKLLRYISFILVLIGSIVEADSSRLRVLFIGNSLTYWNDLPGMVAALAEAGKQPGVVVASVAFPDYSLEDHWKRGEALKKIRGDQWDFVVLQQGPSASSEGRTLLIRYTSIFANEIRKRGAQPVLYSVWPAANRTIDFERSIESYKMAANQSRALLVPAGSAWLAVWKKDPDVELYSLDGLHPTATGSYLSALVFYEVLLKRNCVGLPSRLKLPSTKTVIEPRIATVLQATAHEVANLTTNIIFLYKGSKGAAFSFQTDQPLVCRRFVTEAIYELRRKMRRPDRFCVAWTMGSETQQVPLLIRFVLPWPW